MSLAAAVLLIISACTHAGWNFIGKKQYPRASFFLVANSIGAVCLLPILVYYRDKIPMIPVSVWRFVVIAGFFMAVYAGTLAGAYRTGDMSVAYPLARSSPIIVVFIVTFVLGKGREVSVWCGLGIGLVVLGCFMVPMKRLSDFNLRNYLNLCCMLAVLASVGTAGYTIVDDEALRRLRELPGAPFTAVESTLVYMSFEAIIASLWLTAFVLTNATERRSLAGILRSSKRVSVFMGIGIYLTYGLVLVSMAYVRNVSYVAAFRQLSIPIGSVLGMTLLQEPCYAPKILGVIVIFLGLALVGTG